MRCLHYFTLLFLLSTAVYSAAAQVKAPLTPAAEPFLIGTGSTFTASGGTKKVSNTAVRSIANDIREAERIILANHFDAEGTKPGKITKSALEAMLHSLDPHSNYHDPVEWKELLDEQNSGYTGIGATIGEFDSGSGPETHVLSAAPRSAAAKARLRFGDRIISIGGRGISGIGLAAVRDLLRGDAGTTLEIVVERSASLKTETLVLQRTVISQPSIPAAFILQPGVGYIDLTEGFNYSTSDEFDRAMRDLKRQGMKSLILDLRWNGGGILEQAVKIAEKFLPAGTQILSQRGRFAGDTRSYYSANAAPETMPLVVLVNSRTASASEIVAGAFQDCDRALIVGEKSYGKGLVQTVINLPGGAGLTLTTGRYLTPAGRSIQRDYSSVDLYDYYNQTARSSGIDKAYYEARTVTDRPVYGGDGIKPDDETQPHKMSALQASLIDPIFNFSKELTNGRIVGQESHRDPQKAQKNKILSDSAADTEDLLSWFLEYLSSQTRYRLRKNDILSETKFIRSQLRYYLVMASHGTVAANHVLTETDPQVAHAIETLPRAAQLSRLAARFRSSK